MGQYRQAQITNAGLTLIEQAQITEKALEFTALKTGNGEYTGEEDLKLCMDLKNAKNTFVITKVSQEEQKIKIASQITNENVPEGYSITEIGIFGQLDGGEETLIAITSSVNPDFLPATTVTPSTILVEIYLEVTNTDNVEFTYTIPAGVYATLEDYEEQNVKIANIDAKAEEHKDTNVNTQSGAHGIRFYEDKLQYWNGTEWIDIETGGGSKVYLAEPTNVTITNKDEAAELTWTDPPDVTLEGVTLALWKSTVIVRKEGAAPIDEKDGTVVLESKARDRYATEGFTDTGLTNGITYYYGIFPKTADGICTTTKTIGITPQEIPPSQATDISIATDKTEMSATVTYTLPDDATKAKIVLKAGSEPTSSADGTAVEDSTGSATFTDIVLDTTYYVKVFTYNKKNRETASTSESFIMKSLEIVTWADGTDKQIAAMLEAHYAGDINIADYWSTGQTRTVKIASFSTGSATHVEQNIQMQIIDFEHDDLADGSGKAAVTVDMRQMFGNLGNAENEYYWGSSHYPVADTENYSTSPMRTKLNQDFVAALPETFSALIKTVAKKNFKTHTNSSMETVTTEDKVFLLSYPEVFGTTTYSNYKDGNALGDYEGTQYAHYATESNRKKYINNNGADGDAKYYWLRSPSSHYNSAFGCYWCSVSSSGSASYCGGYDTSGVAAALCL